MRGPTANFRGATKPHAVRLLAATTTINDGPPLAARQQSSLIITHINTREGCGGGLADREAADGEAGSWRILALPVW